MEERNEVLKQEEMVTELQRDMTSMIQRRELPPEVMQVLKETYKRIEEIVTRYNSNPQNTLDYVMSNMAHVKQSAKRIHHKAIEEKSQGIQLLCKGIKSSLENKLENQSQIVKGHIENIASSRGSNNAEKINDNIEEWIRDSAQRANRILASRGADRRTIEAQNDEFRMMIRRMSSRNIDRLNEALINDDKQVLSELLQRYEEYEDEVKINETRNSDRGDFVNELKEGAPTPEQQADFANKRREDEEKMRENGNLPEQQLPDNVIE